MELGSCFDMASKTGSLGSVEAILVAREAGPRWAADVLRRWRCEEKQDIVENGGPGLCGGYKKALLATPGASEGEGEGEGADEMCLVVVVGVVGVVVVTVASDTSSFFLLLSADRHAEGPRLIMKKEGETRGEEGIDERCQPQLYLPDTLTALQQQNVRRARVHCSSNWASTCRFGA